jgi:hypothetical protein
VQPTPMYDRVLLTSYARYIDAQAVVDALSDADFPVEETSIIGRDLRLVEDVTGRLSYGRAALTGAAGGAWFGLLFGLFLGLFADDATSTFALVLWGLLFGALAGAVFSLVGYAMSGGRRDFVSVSQLVADRYDVVVESRTIDDARTILGMSSAASPVPTGRAAPTTAPVPDEARTDQARMATATPDSNPSEADGDQGDRARPSLRERIADRTGLHSNR